MSYLPYGRGTPGGWVLSGLVSVALHGGVIAVLGLSVSQWFVDRPLPLARPEFQITLEQLESDTLAGLVEQLGDAAGQDAAEDLSAAAPDGDLTPEIPEDLIPEEITPDTPEELAASDLNAEELAPEDGFDGTEDVAPEELAPEEFAPEELAAEELAPEEVTPEDPAPEELAAEDLTPEEITPEEVISEEVIAEDVAPEAVAPEEITPEEIAPEPVAPEVVETADAPEELVPDEVSPEPTAPEVAEVDPLTEAPASPPEEIAAITPEDPLVIAPSAETDDPLIVDDGSIQAGGGTPLPSETDALNPITSEDVLPVIPDEQVVVGVTTDTPAEEDFAALTPLEPEVPGEEAIEPTALPLEPEEIAPDPAAPEELTPEEVTPEEVAPEDVATEETPQETVTPETPETPTDTDTVTDTATAAPDAVRPRGPRPRVVRRPSAPPSERDLAIGDLIQRIRARTEDNCVIALPRRDGPDGIGLALLAAEDGAMGTFADAVLVRPEDEAIRQTRTLLDARQCPALAYIARNRDYPATRIGMRLDNAEVPSGNRVSGVMRGVGNRNLGLFLVDNNGVVQDLERFTTSSGPFVRFDIPVTRVGPLRDTKQLLVAIATTEPLDVLRERSGQRAEVFFADLSNALSRQAALAIVAFDVR